MDINKIENCIRVANRMEVAVNALKLLAPYHDKVVLKDVISFLEFMADTDLTLHSTPEGSRKLMEWLYKL